MTRLRVGFHTKFFIEWSGGVDFIAYLANGLARNHDVDVVMLVPNSTEPFTIRFETKGDIPRHKPAWLTRLLPKQIELQNDTIRANADLLAKSLDPRVEVAYYDNNVKGFLEGLDAHHIDAVLPPTISFGPAFPKPWVGYIWDFQHKHLPRFFNDHEKSERDVIFKNTLTEAPSIVVNAQDIKNDVHKYFGELKAEAKITALPFAPSPKPEWLETDVKAMRTQYKLPETYLMVANQFWIHKDHMTAVEAMNILAKDKAYDTLHLVCTGKMEEPREPEYIDRLKQKVADYNLTGRIHFLGYLPKLDQIGIMRGATALLQPTLIEGGPGGGAAYNAIALGVPLIASDIAVNKEISIGETSFFKVGDAQDLADQIKALLKKRIERPANDTLVKLGETNQQNLCDALMTAINRAIDARGHG
jgi:glycosyltransferase involved in cell wall biosynthesis